MSKTVPIPEDIGDYLSYNPDTGDLVWLVSRGRVKAGDLAGSINKTSGYVVFGFRDVLYLAHRVAWFLYYGEQPPERLDHWNNEPWDNRIGNLRSVTASQNSWNASKRKDNTSGFKGVSLHKPSGKFVAQCQLYGGKKHLGYYNTQEEADRAARAFREKHKGEFANHG